MTDERIRVAVVGAGNMGANHVRVYDELPGADLVEVVEPDPTQAKSIQSAYDVTVHDSVADIQSARAASVAVPNEMHRDIAIDCIERGLDVLVEKPLAMSVEAGQEIVDAAAANDVILQVGHIEQYNPAVETLQKLLEDQNIIAIEAHRLGPFNDHLSGESVVFDLMIHDLDIIESTVQADISSMQGFGTAAKSSTLDHAIAQLQFENGVLGTVTASHVTHSKVRELSVVTNEMYITLDYQKQEITLQRTGSEEVMSLVGYDGYRTETVKESPYINRREPLKKQLEDFLTCVTTRERPRVDGSRGVTAIGRVQTLLDSLE